MRSKCMSHSHTHSLLPHVFGGVACRCECHCGCSSSPAVFLSPYLPSASCIALNCHIMSGQHGGSCPGAGRPQKGKVIHGSSSQSPQLFLGSLSSLGLPGTSDRTNPVFDRASAQVLAVDLPGSAAGVVSDVTARSSAGVSEILLN